MPIALGVLDLHLFQISASSKTLKESGNYGAGRRRVGGNAGESEGSWVGRQSSPELASHMRGDDECGSACLENKLWSLLLNLPY